MRLAESSRCHLRFKRRNRTGSLAAIDPRESIDSHACSLTRGRNGRSDMTNSSPSVGGRRSTSEAAKRSPNLECSDVSNTIQVIGMPRWRAQKTERGCTGDSAGGTGGTACDSLDRRFKSGGYCVEDRAASPYCNNGDFLSELPNRGVRRWSMYGRRTADARTSQVPARRATSKATQAGEGKP